MSTSIPTGCREAIADILARRVEWITRQDLQRLLRRLGFSEKQVARALRKGAKAGWLRRSVLNLNPFESTAWHGRLRSADVTANITEFLDRERSRSRNIATPCELISAGDSVAALFGFATSPQPQRALLETKLRLGCALTQYVCHGAQPSSWSTVRSNAPLGHRGAAAVLTNPSTKAQLLVLAPVVSERKKLVRFFENVEKLKVAYEAW